MAKVEAERVVVTVEAAKAAAMEVGAKAEAKGEVVKEAAMVEEEMAGARAEEGRRW